jgi:predicted AlkP superfamily pyrophosphatase or phosphodiesterase
MKYWSTLFLFSSTLFLSAQKNDSPKLIVGVVVDQMCYEYLYRYQDKFGKDGFNLFMEKGTNVRNTLYNYVPTYTGPGHASIYTGTTPENHGIVGNEWFERETNQVVNCVDDLRHQTVGSESNYGQRSPKNLKTFTVTDQLKLTYPDAKVISMSIKDRSAILPGGHLSDGSYWYDFATGNFITSTFFKTELPNWVTTFNQEKQVDNYMQQTWETLYPIQEYTQSGPDNSPYEVVLKGKDTPTFPYDLKSMTAGKEDYNLFTYTPFANTYLTDFAIQSIKAEKLGQDKQTDMLCISYSTPDIAGHAFGPYSVEIQDMYLRLDRDIADLIKALEKEVGKNQFMIFLTADHAVVPVPQNLTDQQLPGGYVFLKDKMNQLKQDLAQKFGSELILEQENLNIYLDHQKMKELNLNKSDVETFIADEIVKWEGVKRVFTSKHLEGGNSDDLWLNMVRRGFHHTKSGDVIFILEPGYLPKNSDTEKARKGTSHGSSFNYDTHVPLIWYGKKIKKQNIYHTVNITDIAATLIHMLNLQRPGAMTGEPILELLNR